MASSFLKRAKSARDVRKRASPEHHQDDRTGLPATILSPARKLAAQSDNSTNIWSRSRMRRKSFSSNRESMMALGLPETWNPPTTTTTTITADERKKRTSAFFGLISPITSSAPGAPGPPAPPKRAPPPPPIRLSVFPQMPKNRPSTSAGIYGASDDDSVIGVALGSPSGSVGVAITTTSADSNSRYQSLASLVTPKDSPGFLLPNSPFGINPHTPVSVSVTKAYEEPEVVAEPKTAGWKRIFGKGLFGRKGAVKTTRGTTPDVPASIPKPPNVKVAPTRPANSAATKKAPPCLDVDIPSIEMERYSVMFGTLLHPSEKSTLYARRRSREASQFGSNGADSLTAGRSPAGHSLEVPKLQMNTLKRNATTTSHISPRSPLSMLGDDLKRLSSESRRSPSPSPGLSPGLWRRGTTAADGRPSASPRHSFLPGPGLAQTTDFALPLQRPQSRSSTVSRISEESASTPSTPPSFDEGDDHRFQIVSKEPAWEMITPTGPGGKKDRDDMSQPQPLPSPLRDEYDELEVAAQISIARQISLSKRQLLIPVVPKSQMLVSRESLKPRLVEHRRSRSSKVVFGETEKEEFGCAL